MCDRNGVYEVCRKKGKKKEQCFCEESTAPHTVRRVVLRERTEEHHLVELLLDVRRIFGI